MERRCQRVEWLTPHMSALGLRRKLDSLALQKIHLHSMVTVRQIVVRLSEDDAGVVQAVMQEQGDVSLSRAVRYIIRQYAIEHGIVPSPPPKKKRQK